MGVQKVGKNDIVIVKRLNESLEELHTTFSTMSENSRSAIKAMVQEILDDMPSGENPAKFIYEQTFTEKYAKRATDLAKLITKVDYLRNKFWHEIRQTYDMGPHLSIGVRKGEFGGLCVVGIIPDYENGMSADLKNLEDIEKILKMIQTMLEREED